MRRLVDKMSAPALARALGVSARQVRRWKAAGAIPEHYRDLLAIQAGELGAVAREFRGWRLQRGAIVAPNGETVKPSEILLIPIRLQQIADAARERARPRQLEL